MAMEKIARTNSGFAAVNPNMNTFPCNIKTTISISGMGKSSFTKYPGTIRTQSRGLRMSRMSHQPLEKIVSPSESTGPLCME